MGQDMQGAGGQLTITTEVENYPGFEHGIQGPELMNQMRAQVKRFGTQMVEDLVSEVDFSERPYKVKVNDAIYLAQTIIIATGASAKWLGIPEERPAWEGGLGGAGISACATCDGFFFRGKEVIVVGGGVSGLGTALALARAGNRITVVERDNTPMPDSADEAFEWDRRGAPQVRHSHAFLARLRNLLLNDYPDVYASLLHEGATEMRFGDDLPPEMTGFVRQPDDDELVMLACRRTTFEWVLRRAAIAEGQVTFRTGVGVDGVVSMFASDGTVLVTGVRLADGTELTADLVIAANGRRSTVPEWITQAGGRAAPEEVEDTGIVYFSRFYRLRDGCEYPPRSGPIGGDLGYVKYGVFVGDNRTFSVTLASSTHDDVLRKMLADPVCSTTRRDSCPRLIFARPSRPCLRARCLAAINRRS